MWTEKHKPRKLNEIVGQREAKVYVLDFIKNFRKQKKKALLFYGPAGCGKTCFVYALTSELGFELVELNASDFRNKQQIHNIIGEAIAQQSLFSKSKLILVDELEGISGTKDRGGLQELMRLIETTSWPILLVTNDASQEKLRHLRSKVQLVKFKPLDKAEIFGLLQKICKKEKLSITKEAFEVLAGIARGDARAAINDLQTLAMGKEITRKDVTTLSLREKAESIHDALNLIFTTKQALGAFDNVDADMGDIFLWLDENLPLAYKSSELPEAYDILSKADTLRGRIRRQQHWRFLVYIMALLSQGIALAKHTETVSKQNLVFKQPSRLLKIWIAKQQQAKKRMMAEKLSKAMHCSKKQAYQELPYLHRAFQTKAEQLANELKLEPEELNF